MPQAKKKARSAVPEAQQITHRLSESFFILTILLAVFLLACLASYDPADPGPFRVGDIAENDDEIAALMASEIAHVLARGIPIDIRIAT